VDKQLAKPEQEEEENEVMDNNNIPGFASLLQCNPCQSYVSHHVVNFQTFSILVSYIFTIESSHSQACPLMKTNPVSEMPLFT
jgi:hypothetical protein